MPLNTETREAIRAYLAAELNRYVQDSILSEANLVSKPFHSRLLPALFNVPFSERSFSTRSGSWWQNVARLVARQYHSLAEMQYRVNGHIKPAASDHIEEVISQLNTARLRRPNRRTDETEVTTVQAVGGNSISVVADLYIQRYDHSEMFFEIKTAFPNKDTSKAMKRLNLQLAAMKKGQPAEAFAATAYNPYGDGQPYTWNYATQFLEVGTDLLVGRPFWTKIGDEGTYEELLDIAAEVGTRIAPLVAEKIEQAEQQITSDRPRA